MLRELDGMERNLLWICLTPASFLRTDASCLAETSPLMRIWKMFMTFGNSFSKGHFSVWSSDEYGTVGISQKPHIKKVDCVGISGYSGAKKKHLIRFFHTDWNSVFSTEDIHTKRMSHILSMIFLYGTDSYANVYLWSAEVLFHIKNNYN